jgi:cytochrome P450
MSQWPANHSARNFKDPESFVPERWLGHDEYKDDNRAVFQPFSVGPRNCLGKNLANAEMRLILAKMVYSLDWELAPGSRDWDKRCKVHALWTKPPLEVRFTPTKQ